MKNKDRIIRFIGDKLLLFLFVIKHIFSGCCIPKAKVAMCCGIGSHKNIPLSWVHYSMAKNACQYGGGKFFSGLYFYIKVVRGWGVRLNWRSAAAGFRTHTQTASGLVYQFKRRPSPPERKKQPWWVASFWGVLTKKMPLSFQLNNVFFIYNLRFVALLRHTILIFRKIPSSVKDQRQNLQHYYTRLCLRFCHL